jgi:hypothetical protein
MIKAIPFPRRQGLYVFSSGKESGDCAKSFCIREDTLLHVACELRFDKIVSGMEVDGTTTKCPVQGFSAFQRAPLTVEAIHR